MLINPKTAIEEGWVTGIRDPELQIQPNAIDFTLDKVYTIATKPFILGEDDKQMRGGELLVPGVAYKGGEMGKYWNIQRQSVYDGMSAVYVKLPEGVAAMLIIRSTLNRNGMFLTSGLYDSGFKGHLGFAIHNRAKSYALIAPGTRVGQVIFVSSDSAGLYTGGWNHEEGTHYSEEVPIGPGSGYELNMLFDSAGGYNHEQGTHHSNPQDLDCDGAEKRDIQYKDTHYTDGYVESIEIDKVKK